MPASFLQNLSSRDRRALALLAAAVALFLILDFGLLPLMDSAGGLGAALPLKEKTLRKYQRLAAILPEREAGWKEMQASLEEAEKRLLESKTGALASAEMQQLVKELMAGQGLDPGSASFQPVRALRPVGAGTANDAAYAAVPLALNFECRVEQLAAFLQAARESSRVLVVEQLGISQAAPRPDRPKAVSVRLVLHGVMRAETEPRT